MLTRIEIDGFKTFEAFSLDLSPLTAIVGPNASGKSNLFDALRFLSLLAQNDIRGAMQGLRGEPEELFRQTPSGQVDRMTFAVEVLLEKQGADAFNKTYKLAAQRLRYELSIELSHYGDGTPQGIFIRNERCLAMSRREDRALFLRQPDLNINYAANLSPFIRINEQGDAIEVRQDGPQKPGRPVSLPLREASRSALSTITTAEFPHLYALCTALSSIRFLKINPHAAKNANDRFENRDLKPDASNLAAVLAHLKEETSDDLRPDGVLADIAADLTSLIPSVRRLHIQDVRTERQYAFSLEFGGGQVFSSRVISDGTLRLLALLTVLNDPKRRGTLCFEEPENGVHEGRIPLMIQLLRNAATISEDPAQPSFQILIATHSPKVMAALLPMEIVAADSVTILDPVHHASSTKTRMRTDLRESSGQLDLESHLTRAEVERLLQRSIDAA